MFTYTFSNLNYYTFKSRNDIELEKNKVLRSLTISMKRNGHNDLLEKYYGLLDTRICNFCGEPFQKGLSLGVQKNLDGTYEIINIGHKFDKPFGKYGACKNSCCKSSTLNSNSIEFVSICYTITQQQARDIIHSRNKSPFYKCNHESEQDYFAHQSHSNVDKETRKLWTQKQINTYNTNKENFINEYGLEKWHEMMRDIKDSGSMDFFIRTSSSIEEAIEKFQAKIALTSHFKPSYNSEIYEIKKHINKWHPDLQTIEDFKIHCLKRLEKYGPIGKTLFLQKIEQAEQNNDTSDKNISFFVYGKILFNIQDLFSFLEIPYEITNQYRSYGNNMYCYHSVVDGYFFRSDMELNLYLGLKELTNVCVLDTNSSYEIGNLKKFDFKIEYNDKQYFLELCSNVSKEYVENVLNKRATYGSILITKKNIRKFLNDLSNNIDIASEDYYEYS